jgi:hypothetical protein
MMRKSMFKIFQEEGEYWQRFFGLFEWKIYYDYKNLKDCWADVLMNHDGAIATIRLNKGWTGKEEIEVRRCAFHEVCHLLLADLHGYCYHKDSEELAHEIIRKLENSVFYAKYNNKKP